MGRRQGTEGLRGVRGARRRRQGRHDQGDHRAGQSAGVPRHRAARRRPSAKSRRCTCSATCQHFPAAGEVVIFDRSWYNRAGVERVMGFCTDGAGPSASSSWRPWSRRRWSTPGSSCIKYWLEVSPEEQTRRLTQRIDDGRKIWKLSPMDLKSYSRWYDYSRARDEMFEKTDTPWAPWYRRAVERQEAGAPEHHHPPPEQDSLRGDQAARRWCCRSGRVPGKYKEPDYPYKYVPAVF